MFKKLMARIYERKIMRHILKGERITQELAEWGCQGKICSQCKGATNHCCGVYESMNKWNTKTLKLYDKYAKYYGKELNEENQGVLNQLLLGGGKLYVEESIQKEA